MVVRRYFDELRKHVTQSCLDVVILTRVDFSMLTLDMRGLTPPSAGQRPILRLLSPSGSLRRVG